MRLNARVSAAACTRERALFGLVSHAKMNIPEYLLLASMFCVMFSRVSSNKPLESDSSFATPMKNVF